MVNPTHQTTQEILKGIQIILKYQPDATFACQQYTIYFGKYNKEDMTEEDCQKLLSYGWFKDTYVDSYESTDMWTIFTD